jgi:class 3 adenylate cyclase
VDDLNGRSFDPSHDLRLRAGVAAGRTLAVRVGTAERWELAVAGPAVADAFAAQSFAATGEVALSTGAQSALNGAARWTPMSDGLGVLLEVTASPDAEVAEAPAVEAPHTLAGYLPDVVRARVLGSSGDWLPELRPVTAVFVRLDDIDARAPDVDRLQTAMALLQQGADAYEGSVDHLVFDDKGTVVTVLFGLPPRAHEDDPLRGMLCAVEIHEQLAVRGVAASMGVATGRVFSGPIGRAERRQYCVIGHVMNLAARLMQENRGDVLACPTTHAATERHVVSRSLGSRELKGIAERVEVYRPTSGRARMAHDARTFGRDEERRRIRSLFANAMRGVGGALWIEGEAGQGKTTLVSTALAERDLREQPCLIVSGDPIGHREPYHAFSQVLPPLLCGDREPTAATLQARLVDAGEPAELAPLLGPLLSLELPETAASQQLSGQLRAERAHGLLASLLGSRCERGLVLVIEDLQLLDSASVELVVDLRRALPTLAVVITTRPMGTEATAEHVWLRDSCEVLELRGLEVTHVEALIAERLSARQVSREATELIMARSGGNPLFVESLCLTLKQHRVLRRQGERVVVGDRPAGLRAIPDSLHAVVRTRIAQLPTGAELTLKAASAIGQRVELEVLHAIHPANASIEQIERDLLVLRQHRMLDASDEGAPLRFDHQITREVAYDLMLFGKRRELHRRIARFYERQPDAPERQAAVLALHYERAGEHGRALSMLERAAEQAMRSGAFREAEDFLQRCLRIADEAGADTGGAASGDARVSDLERARWHRMLAECHETLGNVEHMGRHGERALALLGERTEGRSVTFALGALSGMLGQGSDRLLGRAPWERKVAPEVAFEIARAHQLWGAYLYYWLRAPEMIYSAVRGCRAAELSGDPGLMCNGYGGMALWLAIAGQERIRDHYARRTIAARKKTRDLVRTVRPSVQLGLSYLGTGHWEQSMAQLRVAQRVSDQIEYHTGWGWAQAVKVWHGVYQEELSQVRDAVAQLADRGRRANNEQLVGWAKRFDAHLTLDAGGYAEAAEAFAEALPILRGKYDRAEELLTSSSFALALARSGRIDEAHETARTATTMIGRPTSHILLLGLCDLIAALNHLADLEAPRARADELHVLRRRAMAGLREYASGFPIGRPAYQRHRGMDAERAGDPDAARAAYRKGLRQALSLGLPGERRRLREHLARL